MRLTIINQFYVPDISPTAHLCASLAEHRAALGDEVTVVTSRGGYVKPATDAAHPERENPRVFRVWTPQLGKGNILKRCIDYGCFYIFALLRVLRLPRQDVIMSLTTPPFIAWTGALHKLLHRRTKFVMWNMDCYPEVAERSGKMKPGGLLASHMRFLNRALFRRLDHLIVLDTAMGELLMSQYAPKRHALPVTVVPNWERASFFPQDVNIEPWEGVERLQLRDRFVVLYAGNMGYGHAFDTTLDAAEKLQDEPITFLFVGSGARRAFVEQEALRRNLSNVIVHDYVPKDVTPALMASSHCALITLRDEILGTMSPSKLHSNLAMRLPVIYIGPKASNVDDAIVNFGCGASLRHGDVDGVVDAIHSMQRDPAQHEALREKARNAFDHAYCDECTLPQFDVIIASLTQ